MDDDLNTAGAIGELFALVGETYRYLAEVDRGAAPLDAAPCEAVRDVLLESLDVLLIAGAGRRRPGDGRRQRGRRRRRGLRHRRRGSAARRAARRGRALGRRRARLRATAWAAATPSYACVLRDHYRDEKDWAEADRLRDEIQAAGFEVRDTPQGTQVVRKA